MPLDTKKVPSNGKPITPKAPIRSKTGPYLAPKLASSVKTTPSPEFRRDGRVAGNEMNVKAVNTGCITTPVKSFLATNVTPRSSSRKSRAGSTNSTPNGTPGGTPASSRPGSAVVPVDELQGFAIRNESEIRNTRADVLIGNGTNPLIAKSLQTFDTKESGTKETDSLMFFHASDAHSIPKKATQPIQRQGTGFIYADGRREDPVPRPGPQAVSMPTSQVGISSKFQHSNGRLEASPVISASPNVVSPTTSPKLPNPVIRPNYGAPRHRSTSPLKEFEVPGQQSLMKTRRMSGASAMSSRSTTKSTISTLPARPVTSTSSPDNRMHVKTQSLTSIDAHLRPQNPSVQPDPILFAIQSPQSIADLPASPSFFNIETTQLGSPTTPTSPLISPDRVAPAHGESKIDQLNSMAANARRERKVLDLEISNSSLLAINRTLERELRKQKVELRRYRRLTSGGRLSFVPVGRSVSGTTTISTLSLDSDLTAGSDEEDMLTDIPSEDEEDFEDSDDSVLSLSPEAQAAKDLRQRVRDEKRLQLDLSKHQQLLIDSQKMNESLKRCLGWTEELILEGKKAIEYQVRVSEISIGGRVLTEDDDPDMQDAEPRHGLLSPTNISNPEEILWAAGGSPAGTIIHRPDKSYTSIMADEGKEFREYLDTLIEPAS